MLYRVRCFQYLGQTSGCIICPWAHNWHTMCDIAVVLRGSAIVNHWRGALVVDFAESNCAFRLPPIVFDQRSSQEGEDSFTLSSFNDLTDQLEHLARGARALLGRADDRAPCSEPELETITSQRHLDAVFSDLQHRAHESTDAFDYGMHGPETFSGTSPGRPELSPTVGISWFPRTQSHVSLPNERGGAFGRFSHSENHLAMTAPSRIA